MRPRVQVSQTAAQAQPTLWQRHGEWLLLALLGGLVAAVSVVRLEQPGYIEDTMAELELEVTHPNDGFDWNDYEVYLNGTRVYSLTLFGDPGNSVTFLYSMNHTNRLNDGEAYPVHVVLGENGRTIWERDLTAKRTHSLSLGEPSFDG